MFSFLFSFFTFFCNSCLNLSFLLSLVSFLFCFASISLYVCLLRVSSTTFFFPVSDFPEDFTENFLAGSSFCFGRIPGVGLPNFFI
ncbi:hypothetical protein Hanom_Chr12g01128451 [Helianthus anomalus]